MSGALKMGRNEWTLLFILAAIWGSSFVLNEVALKSLSPYLLVFLRILLGALTLTFILMLRGIYLPTEWKYWRLFLIMGALQNAIPFCLIAWGQQHINAGLTAIFNGTIPFFSVVLAHFATTNEKITFPKAMGLMLGFTGVVSLIGFDSLKDLDLENFGQFAVLGAAICYALSIVWGIQFSGLKSGVAATGMLWSASLMLIPMLFIADHNMVFDLSLNAILAVIALGVFCTAIAYIIFFHILDRAGATATSMVAFLIPISTFVLAWAFLGEVLTAGDLPGIVLVFIGLLLIDGRALSILRLGKA